MIAVSMAVWAAVKAASGAWAPVQMAVVASPTGPHCALAKGVLAMGTPRFREAPKPLRVARAWTAASFMAAVEAGIVLLVAAILAWTGPLVKYFMMSMARASLPRSTAFLLSMSALMPTKGLPMGRMP